ncbi:hypothetical protein GH714_025127 [Hevea brasiliensis]|uniref:Uncharacterized protein n=1 Tax=Hevea brasiliensis TaxID=3981 RepID=A0A6A6MQ31_HEVBR|nr:hypothetical protein GH714_025127 [Hevea brasiliensis]
MALSAICLFFAAGNFFYSSVALHHDMAQRMVSYVNDWSSVKLALDIGCGRGILLNAVATQLKKTGSSGRVVGLDRSKRTSLSTLRTANMEGKEYGHRTVEAAAERMRALGEMVRVLKPGGIGVVWDIVHVPEYVRRLQELKMEDIRVSKRVTAFMVSSHIVSFRKPDQHVWGLSEVGLDGYSVPLTAGNFAKLFKVVDGAKFSSANQPVLTDNEIDKNVGSQCSPENNAIRAV